MNAAALDDRRVLVVGSLNVDYTLTAEREPADDGATRVTGFTATGGGHAGNCAAALAQLGAQVWLFTAVGDDAEGAALLDELAADGVRSELCVRVASAATGRVFIPTFPDRHYLLILRGATERWPADSCAAVDFGSFDAVVLFDPPEPVGRDVLARAASAGVKVYWNPGGIHAANRWVLDPAAQAEWFCVNREEFTALFGVEPDHERVRSAGRRYGIPQLLVTLGAHGCLAADGDTVWSAASPTVVVADPIGAGDAFAAGFVAAQLLGLAWPQPLRWGAAAGAHAVTAAGARGARLSPAWLTGRAPESESHVHPCGGAVRRQD